MPLVLEISWEDWSSGEMEEKRVVVGWDGGFSSGEKEIEISSHFAKALELKHHQEVKVKPLKKLSFATQVE